MTHRTACRERTARLALATFVAGLLGACGVGTAAAVSGGSSGGGTNTSPVMTGFRVLDAETGGPPRTSPAEIRFVLTDAQGDTVEVEFFYVVPGSPARPMTWLTTSLGHPLEPFETSPEGVEHRLLWEFANEVGLPNDESYTPGVLVYGRVPGSNVVQAGANSAQLGLGNDAPVVIADALPEQVSGVVPVRLHLGDSSADPLDVRVEFDVLGDTPDVGWQIARPGGLLKTEITPPLAFTDIAVGEDGADVVFFWDTDSDLPDLERDVRIRVTPIDPVVSGAPAVTEVFRVDNNAAPVVQLQDGAFLANPDSVRGIPVPFTVLDEEADDVTVVFQWRLENETFPALPSTAAAITAILEDEALRREYRICDQYPQRFEGRAVLLDATHFVLPELRSELAHLVRMGIVGRDLGIVRPSHHLIPVSDDWAANALERPVAALPTRGGTHALVLDGRASGGWSLADVRLREGLLEEFVASGPGSPDAACLERGGASVLVVSQSAGAWQLDRVLLASGQVVALAGADDGPVERGEVRGIASLGSNAAVLTVGSSLVRVEWDSARPPIVAPVRTDLATPWGVVVDPRQAGSVLVAENTGESQGELGRVVAIDLATHTLRPVVVQPSLEDGRALPRPRGVALLDGGLGLRVLCETEPGHVTLRAVELRGPGANLAAGLGPSLGPDVGSLAAGEGDVLAATLPSAARVLVAGGIEARAPIGSVDADTARVELLAPVARVGSGALRWRIETDAVEAFRSPTSPEGYGNRFLWDCRDVRGGRVFLRTTVMDAEPGTPSTTTGAKTVQGVYEASPLEVTEDGFTFDYDVGDLDADGDLDLVRVDGVERFVIHEQTAPGVFESILPAESGLPGVGAFRSVDMADLDGDGAVDLVARATPSPAFHIYWQQGAGSFDPIPLVLDEFSLILGNNPKVNMADLDQDGDLDMAYAHSGEFDSVDVYWQVAPRKFAPASPLLGDALQGTLLALRTADLDADGDIDVVCAIRSNPTIVQVWWQAGDGVFEPTPTAIELAPTAASAVELELGDLDADGRLDLACAVSIPHQIQVFWQTSPRVFDGGTPILAASPSSGSPRAIASLDLDSDGLAELVISRQGFPSEIELLWQSAPRQFTDRDSVGSTAGLCNPAFLRVADLIPDGRPEIVCGGLCAPGKLWIFRQEPADPFAATPTSLGSSATTNQPGALSIADLDGDGDVDLATANSLGHNLAQFTQFAPGLFSAVPATLGGPPTLANVRLLDATDLDADGDVDLLAYAPAIQSFVQFRQTAPGTFDPVPQPIDVAVPPPHFMVAADLEGDDGVDLVVLTAEAAYVVWGTPGGGFEREPTAIGLEAGYSPAIEAADLDGDGDLDLLTTQFDNGRLGLILQTGPRQFTPEPVYLTACCPLFATAADLDSDGDQDVVSANYDGLVVEVFWQLAPGQFDTVPTRVAEFAPFAPTGVRVGDLDRDGDLDLVTLLTSGTLNVSWQGQPGRFDSMPTTIPGTLMNVGPALRVVDVDGDGDLDIAGVQSNGDFLSVIWGGRR